MADQQVSGATASRQKQKKTAKQSGNGDGAGKPANQDAIALLKADHRSVEQLFETYEGEEDTTKKQELAREICRELIVHTLLEEEIFYPACRSAAGEEEPLDEAQVEHDSAKTLITELLEGSPGDPFYDAKMKVLAEQIRHHVREEEKPRSGIFALARKSEVDVKALGQQIAQRKQQLLEQFGDDQPEAPMPVSFRSHPAAGEARNQEEAFMARNGNRERDERGRFMDEDDYRRGGGGGGRGRSMSRYEDDDDRQYSSRGRGGGSRYDDDEEDDRRGGGRGEGRGYFGDPEEHARAGRMGAEARWGRSSRDDDDDDDDRGGRSRGGGSSGRGGGSSGRGGGGDGRGNFGNYEEHARAGRMGAEARWGRSRDDDDDDDRGGRSRGGGSSGRGGGGGDGRGYFGDPEEHSRSGRMGAEARWGRSRDDDDDDDRGGRSRGGRSRSVSSGRGDRQQGGWFGDSEGHSEASRRGWRTSDHEGSGWYGDSRGHSEASRRGWENRR